MEILHSLILGVVQGLTELLPVSSSAHLNLFPWVFGWSDISESFDVALHIGTLLAIIIFFYKDWVQLSREQVDSEALEKEKEIYRRKNILVYSYSNNTYRNSMLSA